MFTQHHALDNIFFSVCMHVLVAVVSTSVFTLRLFSGSKTLFGLSYKACASERREGNIKSLRRGGV